jgi:hypothetical protein
MVLSVRAGRSAFDGYTPSVPEEERLDFGSGRFLQLEGQFEDWTVMLNVACAARNCRT